MQGFMEGWSGFMTRQNAWMLYVGMLTFWGKDPVAIIYASDERDFEPYNLGSLTIDFAEDFDGGAFFIKVGIYGFNFEAVPKGYFKEMPYFNFKPNQVLVRKYDDRGVYLEYFIFKRS